MRLTAPPPTLIASVTPIAVEKSKSKKFLKLFLVLVVVGALAAGGFFAWQKFGKRASTGETSGQPFATQTVNGLTVNLISPEGGLRFAENEIIIEFRDRSGQLVDVGKVKFELDMNMPGMVMHSAGKITPTEKAGQYRAKIKPDMGGDWTAQLSYDGAGGGKVNFSVNVKP
ncbi:MAG: FixH family protein [Verrucomicrobiota bacterium]